MDKQNEFLLVLNKLGYRTRGGGAVGGRISYDHPQKDEVVTLRLHPLDGRVLDFAVSKGGEQLASGKDPKQLLRSLQDKGGSGKFRKLSFVPDPQPSPFRKVNASMHEDLDQYGNNIERAIAEIFQLDEQAVNELVSKMKFEEYLNLAIALDNENMQLAEEILRNYGIKSSGQPRDIPTPESVAEHINYLTKNNEDNIVTPEFRRLKMGEQRKVLDSLLTSQLQKMMANLRGYSEPGMYEIGLFGPILREEIISKSSISVVFQEAIPNAPNKPNGANSDERLERDANVAVTDDSGETEDGTIVNDTGNMVTVQTKTGRKSVTKDKIMRPVVDENAIDIKRVRELAGIKTQPIQKQTEEIEEEEEINEEDDSLGSNYTLEVDGENVKKNNDPEELMSYADEHAKGLEWTVYDTETEDIAATWDGTGYLQDAAASSSHRQGKPSGWEQEEELRRNPISLDEPEPGFDWEPEIIGNQEAMNVAQKIAWAIGENWPDGDPYDAAMMTMKRQLGETDTKTEEKIKDAFQQSEGVDFYGYFNQMTDQMQADNPGTHDSGRFKKGGGGKARGQFDDVPRL